MQDRDQIREFLAAIPVEHGDLLLSEIARRNNARRRVRAGGGRKVMRPCPYCASVYSARELIKHRPACNARPTRAIVSLKRTFQTTTGEA